MKGSTLLKKKLILSVSCRFKKLLQCLLISLKSEFLRSEYETQSKKKCISSSTSFDKQHSQCLRSLGIFDHQMYVMGMDHDFVAQSIMMQGEQLSSILAQQQLSIGQPRKVSATYYQPKEC